MSSSSSSSSRGGQPPGGHGGGSHAHGLRVHETESQLDARQTEESRTWRGRAHDHDEHGHERLRVREQPRRQYNFRRRHRSGVLEWAAAVLFTVLAVVVLVGAVSILVVVLLLQPRAPYVAVRAASLDRLEYDQLGTLDDVQLSLRVEAHNDNSHSSATFSRLECRLAFSGTTLAVLRADTFRVPAKGALPLAYVARAQGAPLGTAESAAMEAAIRDGVVPFEVEGEARTRWKVAGLVVINQWTRLACHQMRFFWPNGTALPFKCTSKSKFLFF